MLKWILKIIIAVVIIVPSAFAELEDKGGGLIYDTERNITWLSDANYAETSGYEGTYYVNGRMDWEEAMDWVEDLEYKCYDDWRLPDAEVDGEACSDEDCEETEALSLYVDEDIRQSSPGPFTNIQDHYWTQTEYPDNTDYAKSFTMSGASSDTLKTSFLYVWALRDGDSDPDNCDTDSDDDSDDEEDHEFKVTSECFISCIAGAQSRPDTLLQYPPTETSLKHIKTVIGFVSLLFIAFIPRLYVRRNKNLSD